ncbi:hypothetical protein LCGC14_2131100, partial [marine sediment metagenome]
ALGGVKGVSLLRSGTKAEKRFFKRVGISLEKERKTLRDSLGNILTQKRTGTFRGVPTFDIVVIDKKGRERKATKREASLFLKTREPTKIPGRIEKVKVKGIELFKKISESKRNKLLNFFDNISGGSITESRLNKRQNSLNEDVERFNKDFGSKKLTEAQFKIANAKSNNLIKEQKIISKEKEALANSIKSKVGRLLGTIEPFERLTRKEKEAQLKKIPKIKNRIKSIDEKIKDLKKRDTILSRIKIRGLSNEKISLDKDIKRRRRGEGIRVLTGEVPIVPASGIPKGITSVKFLGSQKIIKGKVITDIIFKTSRGNVGIARGVSVQKGSRGASVVLGRFAEKGVKFPSGKFKLGKIRSFVSAERVVSKQRVFKIKKTVDLIRRSRKVGKVSLIKNNIQVLIQRGIGSGAVVKGRKFFKGVKKVKGISFDDFASLSSIFTRKQLSLIIGKSISRKGAKARFIGLIKGSAKASRGFVFSPSEKQQFSIALKKVISASASAIAQAEQTQRGASKLTSLATASRIISGTAGIKRPITKLKVITTKIKPVTRQALSSAKIKSVKSKVSAIRTTKSRQVVKQLGKLNILQKSLQNQKSKMKQLQKLRQKAKQTQRVKQLQKSLQKQKQRLKLIQKQVQIQIQKVNPKLTLFSIPRLPFPLLIIPRGKE